jgi:prepilin-type processing-associated H-X9-DG protein
MDLRQARRDQASRHNGKFNVAFVDGHVQSMKTNELFGPSEASLRLWNRDNLPKKRGN